MIVSVLTLLFAINHPIDLIVPLESKSKEGDWHATGFLIEKNILMTAAHALNHPNAVTTAHCSNSKKIIIDNKKVYIDQTRDLALTVLPEECSSEVFSLAVDNPGITDPVVTVGCPESMSFCGMVTKGIVSLYKKEYGRLRMYSDMRIWYGNSGGPILNSRQELVGILIEIRSWSRMNSKKDVVEQNFAVITPISEILDFIIECNILRESK